MNTYIYRLGPTRLQMVTESPTEAEGKILQEHFNYLSQLKKDGVVILFGRTDTADENTYGIVVYRSVDDEAAQKIMNNDPAVRGGVMNAVCHPFRLIED